MKFQKQQANIAKVEKSYKRGNSAAARDENDVETMVDKTCHYFLLIVSFFSLLKKFPKNIFSSMQLDFTVKQADTVIAQP